MFTRIVWTYPFVGRDNQQHEPHPVSIGVYARCLCYLVYAQKRNSCLVDKTFSESAWAEWYGHEPGFLFLIIHPLAFLICTFYEQCKPGLSNTAENIGFLLRVLRDNNPTRTLDKATRDDSLKVKWWITESMFYDSPNKKIYVP